jgi:DNA polymerase III delta prime subunit
MNSEPDHQSVLTAAIREGRAVVVAGTGVSIAATIDAATGRPHPQASWSGLLEDGLEWLRDHNLIEAAVADAQLTLLKKNPQTHRFISAAEDVTNGLGGVQSAHFAEWLRRTVGSITPHDGRILEALDAIRRQGNLLATTNYDGLLLGCDSQLAPVTWRDSDALVGAVRNRDISKVIFLHGYWRRPESVILDWKSYDRIARDERYREDLAAFWKTNTWVYIGCGVNGLSDPDFGLLLERYGLRATQAGHWDYCLVRDDQKEDFQAYFDGHGFNIRAIPYGGDNAALQGYLRGLLPPPVVPKSALAAADSVAPPTPAMSPNAVRIRGQYLKEARRDFEARLATSIHHARFIDLGIQDDSSAIRPAWGYHDPDTKQSYATVAEAFAGSDRRLLLLGAPGSGKTTALIHLARLLLQEAQDSQDAPIPFVVNLSKFRFGPTGGGPRLLGFRGIGRKDTDTDNDGSLDETFEDWLVSEMAAFPSLTPQLAREWIRGGQIAALLDGLDEFNDERRADLVRLLNGGFLRSYPEMVVVICSRTNDYLPLRSSVDTRLQLRGCVQLQPLSDEQIAGHLEATEATALLKALPDDEGLRELARTPLTLSMLVLAYGGLAPGDLPKAGSLSESRHSLFESYVARMLQRWERRRRNVQFDDSKENDIPVSDYRYHPQRVHRWLAWLALVLSVRMRTTFAPATFHSILTIGVQPARQPFNFAAVYLALGVLLALCLALIGLPIVPVSSTGALAIAVLAISSCGLLPLAATARKHVVGVVLLVALGGGFVLDVVAIARQLAAALPGDISPSSLGVVLLVVSLVLSLAADTGFDDDDLWKLSGWALGGIGIVVALQFSPDSWYSHRFDRAMLQALVMGTAVGLAMSMEEADGLKEALAFIGAFSAIAISFQQVALRVPELNWVLTLAAIGASIVFVVAIVEIPVGILVLLGYAFLAFVGGLVGGYPGAVVGAAFLFLLWAVSAALVNTLFTGRGQAPRLEALGSVVAGTIVRAVERMVLSPALWGVAAIGRRFAWRRDSFVAFCHEAFLLKQSSQECEFVHRLVRDYFALDALRPRLALSNTHGRLDAIRLLGYQGESALDVLAEFVEAPDASVRAAALTGLSHISSPVVARSFELRLGDRNPSVRQALILGLFSLPMGDCTRLLDGLELLGDCSELDPLLAGLRTQNAWRHEERIYDLIRALGPEAIEPLKQRLRSKDRDSRRDALGGLAQFFRAAGPLLSEHANGTRPWLDPAKPISRTRIAKCAKLLSLPEDVVLAQYQELAPTIGLKIRL